jgi:hypothetical protein
MVSTLAAYSHDLVVLPSTYIATSKEAEPYAFGFSIRVDAPGLRFICRPSVIHQNAASLLDHPLSARFDETDAMAIFDDVLVPWERVFIHRDARAVQRPLQPHRHHAADHAPVLDQELGEIRVHDGARLCDREVDQYRPASARAGHARRADPPHRILPRVYQGERG